MARFSPQFSRKALERAVTEASIRYLFMGDLLGGRPEPRECYDAKGKVDYDLAEAQKFYRRAIERLLDGIARFRVCIMCAEEDATRCHRRLLITRTLVRRGDQVHHVRGSGILESEADLRRKGAPPDRGALGDPVHRRHDAEEGANHPERRENVNAEEHPTCGTGLAEHAVLPAKMGELIGALAQNLEVHMAALDLEDPDAKTEHRAYENLATSYRRIAEDIQNTAKQMAGYRDLPMGRHDEKAMMEPHVAAAFEKFVLLERELLSLLRAALEQDEEMLAVMRA